jgi:hypothetical protein
MIRKLLQDQRHQDPSKLTASIVDFGIGNGRDWDEVVISEELQNCDASESKNDLYRLRNRPKA